MKDYYTEWANEFEVSRKVIKMLCLYLIYQPDCPKDMEEMKAKIALFIKDVKEIEREEK